MIVEYGHLRTAVLNLVPEEKLDQALQRSEYIHAEAVRSEWWGNLYWIEKSEDGKVESRWHLAMNIAFVDGVSARVSEVLTGEIDASKARVVLWRTLEGNWRATGIFGPHVE